MNKPPFIDLVHETKKNDFPVHKTLKTNFADLVHKIQKAPFAE